MKSSDLDELLLAINYVPFLCCTIAIRDVPGVEPALLIERFRIGDRIVEVPRCDGRTADTQLASHSIVGDIGAVVVY